MLKQIGGEPGKDQKAKPSLGANKSAQDAAAKGREALKRLQEFEVKSRSRRDCCGCCN